MDIRIVPTIKYARYVGALNAAELENGIMAKQKRGKGKKKSSPPRSNGKKDDGGGSGGNCGGDGGVGVDGGVGTGSVPWRGPE